MSCPDIRPLVPRFFDGELAGRQMRSVALHVTRCEACEGELRLLEKLQDLIVADVADAVEGIDTGAVWAAVSEQIGEPARPWPQRLRTWWDEVELVSPMAGWQFGAAAVAGLLAFTFLPLGGDLQTGDREVAAPVEVAQRVAQIALEESLSREALRNTDNSAEFESIVGRVERVMVDQETHTTVILLEDSGYFR